MPYILSAIFLWSSLGIVIKLSGVQVHILIFFSSLISAFITGLMFLNKGYRGKFPGGRGIANLFIIGPLSLINTFSFFYAYKNTTVANAILTHYTAPVLVAFLAPIFLRERLTRRVLLAVVFASAGLWIMLGMSAAQFLALLVAGDRNTGGILAGLASGLTYAIIILVFRIFAQNYHPVVLTFSQNIITAVILLPFVEITRDLAGAAWAFAIMGIFHSTIAPVLYFRGLRDVTANRAAILGYLEPVCSIILGVIFLAEGLNYKIFIGGSLILFSGYLTITGADLQKRIDAAGIKNN